MKDPKYKDLVFGPAKLKFSEFGCFICSLSILDTRPPDIIVGVLERNNCFDANGKLLNDTAAVALGMTYQKVMWPEGPLPDYPLFEYPIICETDHFKKLGYQQHFFILMDRDTRIDPLDIGPKPEPNDYNIVSFRLFKKKTEEVKS
jgi:hypothetical protein